MSSSPKRAPKALSFDRDVLVAEEDHLVLEQRRADCVKCLFVERSTEIDP